MDNEQTSDQINVLLVDDSAVIRGMIARIVESDPNIKVAASVANGLQAVEAFPSCKPDVVIMDIEMPVMDGIAALQEIIKIDPKAKIIMCSTLTLENAKISLKAMELGAVDYVPKPTSTSELNNSDDFKKRIIDLVHAFGDKINSRSQSATSAIATTSAVQTPKITLNQPVKLRNEPSPAWRPKILAIGSSTGGPQALFAYLNELGPIKIPIVITQHMPPTFTALLAQHIKTNTGIDTVEADDGMSLEPGRIHLAKGGRHMLLTRDDQGKNILKLDDGPQENYCKPAVDPMLRSLIPIYGKDILVSILTGMGADGMLGTQAIVDAGGIAIAQDKETSVVWGMPGAVATAGLCSRIGTLTDIGKWTAGKIAG